MPGVETAAAIMTERRWFRFSVVRPCLLARVALWIGAHNRALDALCIALMLLALVWG